ncbi:hypothetical protein [Streptomyces venetus]|uniref:hypothetical protein n=1 Tax=Streptomyces venetus TaxID=1701086 RepID=UPI003C2BB18A
MTAQQRLDAILREERLRAYPPFGASQACICFSECPPAHLAHLIGTGRFKPWGVVANRAPIVELGGGAVAYVPDGVYATFKSMGLEHWAVRTGVNSAWLHEREWRLPSKEGTGRGVGSLVAILVGDATWRPSLVETGGWVDRSTLEPLPGGPGDNPHAEQVKELPRLWRQTRIWAWDNTRKTVVKYPAGKLL